MRISFLGFCSGAAATVVGLIGTLLLTGGWEAAAAGLTISAGMQAAVCFAVMVALGEGAAMPKQVTESERRVPRAEPAASTPPARAPRGAERPQPAERRVSQRPLVGA